jgi:riboflavin synthase
MFTGLIEQIGTVRSLRRQGAGAELEIAAGFRELVAGESVAVNGACLTVTRFGREWFEAGISAETLARTTLGALQAGDRVHLERALRLGDRLGGHLVSGHVDAVGRVISCSELGEAVRAVYEVPPGVAPFVAPKGSIAVDGTSLTVNGVEGARFDVVLVPFTRGRTLLDGRAPGSAVNIEVDILAKYVARLLGRPAVVAETVSNGVTLELLAKEGFL